LALPVKAPGGVDKERKGSIFKLLLTLPPYLI
jgi:hypothetical protein